LSVQFTDQSTGNISSRDWNFGDGSAHSSAQNPAHTYNNAGDYIVTLTVTGSGGSNSKTVTIHVTNPTPPPTVTIAATTPLATSLTPGVFTITRTGSTGSTLTVKYSLGGTAANGADYQSLPGSAVIPVGASSTTVVIQPKGLLTVLKTVVLRLSPNSGYTVGSPASATVTIVVSL
jgi:PKD repeat protein